MTGRGLSWPRPLRPGDRVALVALASPVGPEGWRSAQLALERLGYQVEQGERRSCAPSGYAAGPPAERAAELNRFFQDPEIRGIWCIRGGYTAAQVLPLLDYEEIARHPKVFVGYSDITCLHLALNQRCGFVTYHGPMAYSDLAQRPDPGTMACLKWALGDTPQGIYPERAPLTCIRPGTARGILTGGNLTVLAAAMGTPWALRPEGKLLFLEETGEPVPVVERMLEQLRSAGVFRQAAGVLLGSFSDCVNPAWKEYSCRELFRDFFRECSLPVLAGLSCGHCVPNGTLPLGALCRMDSRAGQLWVEGAG